MSWTRTLVSKLPAPRNQAALDVGRAVRRLVRGEEPPKPERPDLQSRLDIAFSSGDPDLIDAALTELNELRDHAQALASPANTDPSKPVEANSGAQSLQFMVDLLPHLQRYLSGQKRWSTLDVLDIGPGSGMGTALLATMYQQHRLGYQLRVSALDITPTYRWYLKATTKHVSFICEDIYTHAGLYDIVIASHVIEHILDPLQFVRRMQEVSRGAVFIVAPFEEPADNLTSGHVSVIDQMLVEAMEPDEWTTIHSASWGASFDPPYEMLIARLPGRAS